MLGIEFVKDRLSKAPDAELVSKLVQECAANGLIIENAGTYGNVIRSLSSL